MPKRKAETVASSLVSPYQQTLEDVASQLGSGSDGDERLDAALEVVLAQAERDADRL
jgi:hypothetical protein